MALESLISNFAMNFKFYFSAFCFSALKIQFFHFIFSESISLKLKKKIRASLVIYILKRLDFPPTIFCVLIFHCDKFLHKVRLHFLRNIFKNVSEIVFQVSVDSWFSISNVSAFLSTFSIPNSIKNKLKFNQNLLKSRVEVDRNSETLRRNLCLLDLVKRFQLTFPGFMSVAVFVTDQSKYTENF